MAFTINNMEYYLLVLMRMSAFVLTAPFFSYSSVPARVKFVASFFLAIIVIQMHPVTAVSYSGLLGFSAMILKESLAGAILGFLCRLCMYIVSFAGQIMDIEMGLSMAQMFDPSSNMQVTITGNIYNYALMLMMVVTNMHYYIIRAIVDSFSYFDVGKAVFDTKLKDVAQTFMVDYFMIALRIVLPVFCCMLMINVVLGVLTKAAPQMNMFSIGVQIKVLAGMAVLVILVQSLPSVSDFIFGEMKTLITDIIHALTPRG